MFLCVCETNLGALQRDQLGGLVRHGARRLRAGRARRGLRHLLLLVPLEPLLAEVTLGLRLETLNRLRPSSYSTRTPELLGGNSIDIKNGKIILEKA